MKKYLILMMMALSLMFIACSNGSSSSDDTEESEDNTEINKEPIFSGEVYTVIAFKINGIQCFKEPGSFIYIKDYSRITGYNSNTGSYGISKLGNTIRNEYIQLPSTNFDDLVEGEIYDNNIWPRNENGTYTISDIKIYIYTSSEYNINWETDNSGQCTKITMERNGYNTDYFYINNTGANSFEAVKDTFNLQSYRKGDNGNLEIFYPEFSAYSFVPDTSWINDTNYDNINSYIYKFKVICKNGELVKNNTYKPKEFEKEIDLKQIFAFDYPYIGINFYDKFIIE